MEEVKYSPEEIIFSKKNPDDNSLYFILNGEIDIKLESQNNAINKTLKTLKKNDIFGEVSFFTGLPRNAYA